MKGIIVKLKKMNPRESSGLIQVLLRDIIAYIINRFNLAFYSHINIYGVHHIWRTWKLVCASHARTNLIVSHTFELK